MRKWIQVLGMWQGLQSLTLPLFDLRSQSWQELQHPVQETRQCSRGGEIAEVVRLIVVLFGRTLDLTPSIDCPLLIQPHCA